MFLMFSLGRLDVLPHGDLGVRIALRDLYGLKDLPDVKRARRIAEKWRPYATIASWYCWRSLEFKKAT
jgi:DNA-3-methyladenine glycosylase II